MNKVRAMVATSNGNDLLGEQHAGVVGEVFIVIVILETQVKTSDISRSVQCTQERKAQKLNTRVTERDSQVIITSNNSTHLANHKHLVCGEDEHDGAD